MNPPQCIPAIAVFSLALFKVSELSDNRPADFAFNLDLPVGRTRIFYALSGWITPGQARS